MLEKVRRPSRAKNFVAYLVFGAIIIVFVGFGMVPGRTGGDAGSGVAAVVNRSAISLVDFQRRIEAMEKQYQSRLDHLTSSQREQFNARLRGQAMEDLIASEVAYQAAKASGVRISDAEVADTIWQIPAFQEDGQFRRTRYDGYLSGNQLTSHQFEEQMRKQMVLRKLQSLFQDAFVVATIESEKQAVAKNTKLSLGVVSFGGEVLEAKIPVSASEISKYLEDKENLEKVKKTFTENQAQYNQPEEIRARHILLRVDPAKKGDDAAVKVKVDALAKRLEKESFAKLAAELSDDTASKVKDGDLGFFRRGTMVPEFDTAAFAAPIGKVVGPVKTQYGYHFIKVEEKKPEVVATFDSMKNKIAREQLVKGKTDPFVAELSKKVEAGDLSAVNKALKELDLKWEDTGEFSIDTETIPKVGENDRLLDTVLAKGVEKGLVKELIRNGGKYFLVDVKSVTKPSPVEVKTSGLPDNIFSQGVGRAIDGWVTMEKARASIERNGQLIAQ